ncbi:hypothetical protein PFISCL1PPCAC_18557, partial [Pristionchus fissidentatus]
EYADRLERLLRNLVQLISKVSAHALRHRAVDDLRLHFAFHHELGDSSLHARAVVAPPAVVRQQEVEAGLGAHREHRP